MAYVVRNENKSLFLALFAVTQENDMTIRRPVGSSGSGGLVLESQLPHLIGMDEDILNTGIFIYNLKVRCF